MSPSHVDNMQQQNIIIIIIVIAVKVAEFRQARNLQAWKVGTA